MAFTLDQNVSGAAAAPQAVEQVSNTSIAAGVIGGLLDTGASLARRNAGASGPTQTDRDRTAFKKLLREAQADKARGVSVDELSQKYAPEFASLGLNAEEKAVVTNTFGEDIFYTEAQQPNVVDQKVALFNQNDPLLQLGYIQQEVEKANAAGETISQDVAARRAVERYAVTQVAANAGIMQGNLDFNTGFDQNIKTLDSFTAAVGAALRVEQGGGDFSLENLQQLRDGFLILKSQPAFQKPTDKLGLEKWAVMEGRLNAIENTFKGLENYDANNATAEAKRLMAQIALKGDSPLSVLAVSDPTFMTKMAAKLAPELTESLATVKDTPVTDYSQLDFDPVVLELMGVSPSGAKMAGEGSSPIPPEPFPAALKESLGNLTPEERGKDMKYHAGVIQSMPQGSLTTPDAVNAFASSVTALSYNLTNNKQVSTDNFDTLFSDKTINQLNALSALGGENGKVAANLRAQMGAALQYNQALVGRIAAGTVQQFAGIGIDSTTGKFTLTEMKEPIFQELSAVVSTYYGGDFEAMWKEGASAKLLLQSRLAREGKIEPDSPSFDRFNAATKVLESSFWKGMASKYSQVQGIPQRLKKFKDIGNKLKLDLPSVEVGTPAVQETPEITVTELPSAPLSLDWSSEGADITAIYNSIPVGSDYFDPDGNIRTKGGN